jgi:hypothetical protein
LKKEEDLMRQKIRLHLLDRTYTVEERKRNRRYRENDEAIITLVRDFDVLRTNGLANDEAILHHLRSLQFRLSKYEDWN